MQHINIHQNNRSTQTAKKAQTPIIIVAASLLGLSNNIPKESALLPHLS
jgi:hypothetical protein